MAHRRRTGWSGFSGISGAAGSVEWWGGVLFAGALALAVLGVALSAAGVLGVVDALATELAFAAGAGLFWGGLVTTLIGQAAMGDSWRIGVDERDRTELVVRGPFEAVRNPIFAGMIPSVIGLVLMVPNVVVIVAAVALIAALEIQTRLVGSPTCCARTGGRTATTRRGLGASSRSWGACGNSGASPFARLGTEVPHGTRSIPHQGSRIHQGEGPVCGADGGAQAGRARRSGG